MNKEVVRGTPLSGVDFIDRLNDLWGGELFLSINPEIRDELSDVRPFARKALFKIFNRQKLAEGYGKVGRPVGIFKVPVSGDLAADFGEIAVQGMPYSKEEVDRIQLISDVFCRTVLVARLERFFSYGVGAEIDLPGGVVLDDLPVPIVLSEVLFETGKVLPDFRSQIGETYRRADELSNRLAFSDEEREQWVTGFQASLKTLDTVHEIVSKGLSHLLHPALRVGYSSALDQHRKALRKKNR